MDGFHQSSLHVVRWSVLAPSGRIPLPASGSDRRFHCGARRRAPARSAPGCGRRFPAPRRVRRRKRWWPGPPRVSRIRWPMSRRARMSTPWNGSSSTSTCDGSASQRADHHLLLVAARQGADAVVGPLADDAQQLDHRRRSWRARCARDRNDSREWRRGRAGSGCRRCRNRGSRALLARSLAHRNTPARDRIARRCAARRACRSASWRRPRPAASRTAPRPAPSCRCQAAR